MKFFRAIFAIFKSYDYSDKVLTAGGFVVFLLMILKMSLFPYGLFGFGATDVYTEGLVAKNGIQNLNPLFIDYNEADREVSRLIFSGLMKYDPDTKAVVDDMASLMINEDKTEYTLKMREGIKWHDGQAVTAEDAYFTFHDVVLHPSFPNEILKTNFSGVEIELLDEMTIKFTLESPNVFFISNLTTGLLPEHLLAGVDPFEILQSDFNKKPIGTGPYMVNDPIEVFGDGRSQITLARFEGHYDGVPKIENMRFIVYPTMTQLLDQINAVNGVVKVTGENIVDFENNERFELIPYELPQYTAVYMNMESRILSDNEKVRLALLKAVDKDELIGESVDKVRVDTPLMELDQDDWVYQVNVEQAQGALKEAGYEYGEEDTEKVGIRYNEDGEGLELNFIARLYDEGTQQYQETLNVVNYLQNVWEGIGFSIQVELLPNDLFKERVIARQYDLLLVGQNLGYNLDTYSYWHSAQATPYGQNFSNYKSFQVDTLIESIRTIFDQEKKKERLAELAEKLKEDIPALFLFRPLYYYATDGKVEGVDMSGVVFPSDRFARIGQWTFAE